MKSLSRTIGLAFAVLACAATARAQTPFGIRQGMTAAQLQREIGAYPDSDTKGMYYSSRVPSPDPAFELYAFMVSPTTGVCKVIAQGVLVGGDPEGNVLRRKYERQLAALEQKYGQPAHSFDYLEAGSIETDPIEFMIGLHMNARHLSAFWGDSTSALRVELKAMGVSEENGFVYLSYQFSNGDKCIDELSKLNNSSP